MAACRDGLIRIALPSRFPREARTKDGPSGGNPSDRRLSVRCPQHYRLARLRRKPRSMVLPIPSRPRGRRRFLRRNGPPWRFGPQRQCGDDHGLDAAYSRSRRFPHADGASCGAGARHRRREQTAAKRKLAAPRGAPDRRRRAGVRFWRDSRHGEERGDEAIQTSRDAIGFLRCADNDAVGHESMIRKSGNRFSEKDHASKKDRAPNRFNLKPSRSKSGLTHHHLHLRRPA